MMVQVLDWLVAHPEDGARLYMLLALVIVLLTTCIICIINAWRGR